MTHRAIVSALALLVLACSASATTIRVDVGGGGDYDNFYSAVLIAAEGDTILVAPGTYTGASNWNIDPGGGAGFEFADRTEGNPTTPSTCTSIDCHNGGNAEWGAALDCVDCICRRMQTTTAGTSMTAM